MVANNGSRYGSEEFGQPPALTVKGGSRRRSYSAGGKVDGYYRSFAE